MREASYDWRQVAAPQADQYAQYVKKEPPPEERIATMVREDLGITVSPQAVRMFIRARWGRLSKAAHEVHDA